MPITFVAKGPVTVENHSTGKIFEDCTLVDFVKNVSMSVTIPRGVAAGVTLAMSYNTDDKQFHGKHEGNNFRSMGPKFTAVQN